MKKLYFLLSFILLTSLTFSQSVIITRVVDGGLASDGCSGSSGASSPKAIELYVDGTINFTGYTYDLYSNGGTSANSESLTDLGIITDAFVYVVAFGETTFDEILPGATKHIGGGSFNGDDTITITSDGSTIVDQFGVIGTDVTGEEWEYLDTYAKRNDSNGPNSTFTIGEWTTGTVNEFDGTDCATLTAAVSFGTFTYGGTPCGISLGTAVYACSTSTLGDNNDGVTVEIPYTGLDATITSVSTTSGGTVAGSNPALDTDGTITITGLFEGDAWDLTINGGNCDTTTVSGTIPVAECDPSLTVNVGITGTVDGVYINEIHYDNTDADVGEFFEVAGPAGTDLSSYTVSLYNGSDDELYGSNDTFNLTGTIDDEGSGVGAIVVSLPSNGLQNGGPDGLSLSKTGSNDIQFLSYEGVIASAGDGPAIGLASVDIGVSENQADTPAGYSLEYDETTTSWIVVTDDTPGDFAQGTALSNGDFNLAKFSLFPNPTNSGYVNITSTNGGTINAKVFDILGKKVIDASIENNRLDVNQLKTGIYIIKMTQGTHSTTKKLVIE